MEQIAGERVVVWGDSLAKGVVWNETRKRHAYSKLTAVDIAANKLGIEIINRSKFGCTAPLGMELMERDVNDGIVCDTAVIEFGGNDCNFDWAAVSERPEEQHLPATPPQEYLESLRAIVRWLVARNIRPVLMTLPPIDAERYFHFLVGDRLNPKHILKWLGDVQQIYRYQELYSLMIEKVAREFSIQLIDLRQRCLENRGFVKKMICADGLHLTEEGQQFIGEAVADLVIKENI
ncbi:MAG TPA: GDSL-type esterase/lipase family protein [Clostridia bacterium]|nr:GDSL-type esterase/lipase family protein [Clostridia bacterium]